MEKQEVVNSSSGSTTMMECVASFDSLPLELITYTFGNFLSVGYVSVFIIFLLPDLSEFKEGRR